MKAFVDAFDAHHESFDLLVPLPKYKNLILKAESYDFKPLVIGSEGGKGRIYDKNYQLDVYLDPVEGERFSKRCGLVFKQENTGYARNSHNWTLLFIIYITYLRSLIEYPIQKSHS